MPLLRKQKPAELPTVAQYDPAFDSVRGRLQERRPGMAKSFGRRLAGTDNEGLKGTHRGKTLATGGAVGIDQLKAMGELVTRAKESGDWSAVPPEFRPLSSTPHGKQLLANEAVFTDERVLERQRALDKAHLKAHGVLPPWASADAGPALGKNDLKDLKDLAPITTGAGAISKQGATLGGESAGGDLGGTAGGAIGGLLGLGAGIGGMYASVTDATSTNGAIARFGRRGAIDQGIGLTSTLGGLGSQASKMAHAGATLAGNSSAVAGVADVIPGFGLATSSIGMVHSGKKTAEHSHTTITQKGLRKGAAADDVMSSALEGSISRHTHRAVFHGVSTGASALKVAGNAVTLSGVGAAAGAGLTAAGTVVGGVNSGVDTLHGSYAAGRVQDLRYDARFGARGDGGASAARKLVESDPKHRAQTMLLRAKDGDATALQYLRGYGIKQADLGTTPMSVLRDIIVKGQETAQENETLGQTIVGLPAKLKAKFA